MATQGRTTDNNDKQRAVNLKANGRSTSEIARRLGLSRPTVRKILRERD